MPQAGYQCHRLHAILDRLEEEARRMLQLEAQISAFAIEYYEAVGTAVMRLIALEQVEHEPLWQAAREMGMARNAELKWRYRTLAKEMHPDRAGSHTLPTQMHQLNAAYRQGDLAALLRLEAQWSLMKHEGAALVTAFAEVEAATQTYVNAYRMLLRCPLYELMQRSSAAGRAGADWMAEVRLHIEERIAQAQREYARANIAAISAWREAAA